ncbi:MAG: peptidylprolyl isomerase [Alphaproteobacteria bacterium]|nr:peptidylprolyl isomerase [Alphaproteobacteria bacterium]
MPMKWTCGLAMAVALAAHAPAPAHAQMAEAVAAVVNDEVVSTYDVRQRALLILISSGIQPTQESLQQASAQALRDLVDERLQMQEAKEFEIEVPDDQVDEQLSAIARQNNSSAEALARGLADSGVSVTTLRNQIRADIAWRRLIGGRYGSRVRISDVQIRETQQRIAQSATRAQYQVSEIFLGAGSQEEKDQAEQFGLRLLQEMQRGAPFPLVARQFSSAPSAAAGGDLGWVGAGEMRPELESVVASLQPGQVSRPIRSEDGIYILALRDRREGVDPATTTRVSLRQISAPASSRAAFERARARIASCDDLAGALAAAPEAQVADLGEALQADLSETVSAQIANVPVGQASPTTESGDLVQAFVVCARATGGGGVPDRDEIEDRLYEQELAMLSNRYLRNLRREATIITR